jgi:DNA-directed RNA polymerase specialized sigma24 family protein
MKATLPSPPLLAAARSCHRIRQSRGVGLPTPSESRECGGLGRVDASLLALELGRRHSSWWIRRYPALHSLREDIAQEATLAAWLAGAAYREGRASFHTFAFPRMRTAVRAFLEVSSTVCSRTVKAGRGSRLGDIPAAARSALETDRPCLLREAADALLSLYRGRGNSMRDAEVLARLDLGQTLAEAGRAVGVSRQRAHQILRTA